MLATISKMGRKYLRMHLAAGVGPIRLRKLIEHFGSIDAMLGASVGELQRVSGVGPKVAEAVFGARDDEAVEHEIARASECGARIVCLADEDYPKPLQHIPDPP
ncbi:MAG: helix-hairpin-helix domain-containing protein, partial [Phycisphaerales bacterium]|nr:helix-hairpin-helix domain-containing protein [Phycisphaerales bacterium]